jgi:hypothetical protein
MSLERLIRSPSTGDLQMVEFLKDHVVLSLIAAYVFGQLTAVLVLGVLVPRDPAEGEEAARVDVVGDLGPVRRRVRRPRRQAVAAPTRSPARISLPNRLRRFVEREEPASLN